jgi:type I restriction enzyme S subunit
MPSINTKILSDIPICYPPLPTQHAIARILGSLDDKIELNRKMNETLEAMARAIFQSWFVDFDPVRAKAEGRDTELLPEIAALFPDGFEEVDGREVPRGWGIGSIYEIADVIYGSPFSSKLFNTDKRGLPLIRIRDLSTQDPEIFTDEDQPRGEKINHGDIIVGMDGEFKIHVWTGPISWLNQRVCKFAPKNLNSTLFLKYSILDPVSFFERSKVGTTIIHLGKSDIDTFRILIPSKEILAKFGEITEPISQKIVANAIESRTLAHMRDALLPKLMSGEIQVEGNVK